MYMNRFQGKTGLRERAQEKTSSRVFTDIFVISFGTLGYMLIEDGICWIRSI